MKNKTLRISLMLVLLAFSLPSLAQVKNRATIPYDLSFDYLPQTWDEGLPLGNGHIGALIWEKDSKLRLSMDHVNLWDLRPMENLEGEEWKFSWVVEQWKNKEYQRVQNLFDVPYDASPAPSKIPGAAIEFATQAFGKVLNSNLNLNSGIAEVTWDSGVKLKTFVHATQNAGFFKFEGLDQNKFIPEISIPAYALDKTSESANSLTGQDLRRLKYDLGDVTKTDSSIVYVQQGWAESSYQVSIRWKSEGTQLVGVWSISVINEEVSSDYIASELTSKSLAPGYDNSLSSHLDWWKNYWSKSSISIPDSILERQWYLEQYKFGAAARADAPPISLQAVWTADNGKLPPWKGDFHHDLNTQLSYWPAYSGNHLDLSIGYVDWLWQYKDTFKAYTKAYFGTNGLNVPGVTTLTGEPMGGWIQYSFGPTVSGWLAQHFYLQWRYSMDREFLENRAYPWFAEVATYLNEVSIRDENGNKKLPASSSPELHNNSPEAWFDATTNFDLAIIRYVYTKAAELARELGNIEEAESWEQQLAEWPNYAVDPESGLMIAPGIPFDASHRHFSHLMGIHPLSLINWSDGAESQEIIRNTVANLKVLGSKAWVGYSFSWLGNLQARMLDGNGAAETLRLFAENFCLPNSFHVNGDQSGKGYSDFTYRPFTLEGNFAFAAGVQEMLIQSHEGFIRLFPAIPENWETASFDKFLAEGAFELSATKNGNTVNVSISSRQAGPLKILNPFPSIVLANGDPLEQGAFYEKLMEKGERLELEFRVVD
ncbi:glycoside hydrolase family 95 protein [Algoriphagus chordae]|uniref:Alpha-L-fucosidase 2 n=1 Tax=Algoriphagus chordae TaxID=237019 RepID=A0A2W7QR33_9BACT|nr:glycoside hydrolase family 95 protein [Algoriphagus chordae]PZX51048.1 hypothetical protein LV85_02591 [Algoriphagus chordae]